VALHNSACIDHCYSCCDIIKQRKDELICLLGIQQTYEVYVSSLSCAFRHLMDQAYIYQHSYHVNYGILFSVVAVLNLFSSA